VQQFLLYAAAAAYACGCSPLTLAPAPAPPPLFVPRALRTSHLRHCTAHSAHARTHRSRFTFRAFLARLCGAPYMRRVLPRVHNAGGTHPTAASRTPLPRLRAYHSMPVSSCRLPAAALCSCYTYIPAVQVLRTAACRAALAALWFSPPPLPLAPPRCAEATPARRTADCRLPCCHRTPSCRAQLRLVACLRRLCLHNVCARAHSSLGGVERDV